VASDDFMWEFHPEGWEQLDCDPDVYAVTWNTIPALDDADEGSRPTSSAFEEALLPLVGEPKVLDAALSPMLPENGGMGLCPSTGATLLHVNDLADTTTGEVCACMFVNSSCGQNRTLDAGQNRSLDGNGSSNRSLVNPVAERDRRRNTRLRIRTGKPREDGSNASDEAPVGASDANVTAFFCPYNAATSCMEEGMECPNSTNNPATHETWSEDCLEACATVLAAKMDLSDLDTRTLDPDTPLNETLLHAGGIDFAPKEIQVGVEREITFKGDLVKDGAKAVFLPAGDHTCSGADAVSEFMSGVITNSSLTLTFPATGSYKLCVSFSSVLPGGEDFEDFELANIFHLEVVADPNAVDRGGRRAAPKHRVPWCLLRYQRPTTARPTTARPATGVGCQVRRTILPLTIAIIRTMRTVRAIRTPRFTMTMTMRVTGSTTALLPSRAPGRVVRRCRSRSMPRAWKTVMSASSCRRICRRGTRSLARRT
jgi:hypothetical protein